MKVALSILLVLSVLLNIFLVVRCCRPEPEPRTIAYKGAILSDEQLDVLKVREEDNAEILKVIDQYHGFIKKVKGKQLIVPEKDEGRR